MKPKRRSDCSTHPKIWGTSNERVTVRTALSLGSCVGYLNFVTVTSS
jgi:hypothetical protein